MRTDESLVGTRDGVVRARTIRRLAPGQRGDKELLDAIKVVVRKPVPSSEADVIPVVIMADPVVGPGALPPEPEVHVPVPHGPRRVYIRNDKELRHFGYTQNCVVCVAAQLNQTPQPHSAVCRTRIENEMARSEEGKTRLLHGEERLAKKSRIEAADEAMQDAIAAGPPGAASSSGPSGSGDMETDVHEMRSALFSLGIQASRVDVGELFSPGRLQELCAVVGLTPGGTFDLRTGWDFSEEEVQRKGWEVIQKMELMFILGSPKCVPPMQLQNIRENTPEFRAMLPKAQCLAGV